MAKFLNTSATTYILEELILRAKQRVVLISPYLKFNKRIKQLIEDKAQQGVGFHIVYGKKELKSTEKQWLEGIEQISLHYCQDLHAKCYLNEAFCIITSMNLYEFSQVNNNEMGILITEKEDKKAYADAVNEACRIIRISEDCTSVTAPPLNEPKQPSVAENKQYYKITTSALAKKNNMKTSDLLNALKAGGYIYDDNGMNKLTEKGHQLGAEFRKGGKGYYFIWPKDLII